MLYGFRVIIALLVSTYSLAFIYMKIGPEVFLAIVAILAIEMRIFMVRKVGLSWWRAYFLCFVLNPVLIVVEILFISQFFQNK